MESVLQEWEAAFEKLRERLCCLFKRRGSVDRSLAYIKGLLSDVPRKTSWQLSEWSGEKTPDGIQYLLERAQWDADQARDRLRHYIVEHLGEAEGVLILDETGFIKKGQHSAGVQRQYSGTAGRIENSQIGVFLCYATAQGSGFIDRALYIPESWTKDRERCRAAGIPEEVKFATKPALARNMLEHALDHGVACAWVTGDEAYGRDRALRGWLESRQQAFVLAVAKDEPLWWQGFQTLRADHIAAALPAQAWQRLSAGTGTKGERLYDWALTPLYRLQDPESPFGHYLLVRRSLHDKSEHAYYVVYAPKHQATLSRLVGVAGRRWEIEIGFEVAKGECGLDHYEVRQWHAWYRHITLALWAHAFLVSLRVKEQKQSKEQKKHASTASALVSRKSVVYSLAAYGACSDPLNTPSRGHNGADLIRGMHSNLILKNGGGLC
jgi:SRSO17 transposase